MWLGESDPDRKPHVMQSEAPGKVQNHERNPKCSVKTAEKRNLAPVCNETVPGQNGMGSLSAAVNMYI